MKFLTSLFITAFLIVGFSPLTYCQGNSQLIFIQSIWRHGDRSPTSSYPGDLYDESAWPQGFGQLSTLGMQEHILLGKKIKNRYYDQLKFINKTYYNYDIYVRSTDVNRTIISAISNFIGFYYNSYTSDSFPNVPEWPKNYVPIPIHTIDDDTDNVANPDSICPRRYKLYDLLKETPEYKNISAKCSGLLNYLSNSTNASITLENLWLLRDGIFIEKSNNKKVPTWIDDDNFKQIEECDNSMDDIINGYNVNAYKNLDIGLEISKLRGGAMISEIINRMEIKKKCNDGDPSVKGSSICKLKYYAYSAHDTTVASFLTVLGKNVKGQLVPKGLPHYSAATFIELWYDNTSKQYYVKAQYVYPPNGTFGIDLNEKKFCDFTDEDLKNPDKNTFCDFTKILPNSVNGTITLDQFAKNAKPYAIQDYAALCLNTDVKFGGGNGAEKTIIISNFMLSVFILLRYVISF
uniref:Histidine phosphatase superfamily (Branch 2) n=1 Tax=Strongyloides venezuelensis TaxID=75913 RepID=A0A0K0FBI2_STRVS